MHINSPKGCYSAAWKMHGQKESLPSLKFIGFRNPEAFHLNVLIFNNKSRRPLEQKKRFHLTRTWIKHEQFREHKKRRRSAIEERFVFGAYLFWASWSCCPRWRWRVRCRSRPRSAPPCNRRRPAPRTTATFFRRRNTGNGPRSTWRGCGAPCRPGIWSCPPSTAPNTAAPPLEMLLVFMSATFWIFIAPFRIFYGLFKYLAALSLGPTWCF